MEISRADQLAKERTDLAATRTSLAAERTLMAWIRTALSMIGFGFTIYKFLHGLHEAGNLHLRRPEGPRIIGLFLAALGTSSLLAGIVEYVLTLHRMPVHDGAWACLSMSRARWWPSVARSWSGW